MKGTTGIRHRVYWQRFNFNGLLQPALKQGQFVSAFSSACEAYVLYLLSGYLACAKVSQAWKQRVYATGRHTIPKFIAWGILRARTVIGINNIWVWASCWSKFNSFYAAIQRLGKIYHFLSYKEAASYKSLRNVFNQEINWQNKSVRENKGSDHSAAMIARKISIKIRSPSYLHMRIYAPCINKTKKKEYYF